LDYDLCFIFFKLFASTEIKQSNLWDNFFISNSFQIFGYNKNKSNQISWIMICISNFWVFALTYQIKSNFVAII